MNRLKLIAFALLLVGICLAAAFGSRNGPDHVTYRLAQGDLAVIDGQLEEMPPPPEIPETPPEPVCSTGSFAVHIGDRVLARVFDSLEACEEKKDSIAETPEDELPERSESLEMRACRCTGTMQTPKPAEDPYATKRAALLEQQATLSAVILPKPMERLTQWFEVGGIGWLAGVLLIIGGAILARKQQQMEMSGVGETATDTVDFLVSVNEVLERLERLAELLKELPMDQDSAPARELIDGVFNELIEPVVDNRGRYVARHGLAVFADYFGAFAGGERNLARTWSAVTDGHSEEARAALGRSVDSFTQAKESWEKAEAATSTS